MHAIMYVRNQYHIKTNQVSSHRCYNSKQFLPSNDSDNNKVINHATSRDPLKIRLASALALIYKHFLDIGIGLLIFSHSNIIKATNL